MSDKKITLLDILKSKISNKENMPEWYDRRLSICSTCSFNSINKPSKDMTMKEKGMVVTNLGEPSCLSCGCEISAKTSLPHAKCPLPKPKWAAIETFAETSSEKIVNISTTPLVVTVENNETILNYGDIPLGEPTDVQLLIVDKKNEMTDISADASCGCTVPKLEKKGKDIILKINYNTSLEGEFNKTVVLTYKKNNMKFEKIFKIKGKTI